MGLLRTAGRTAVIAGTATAVSNRVSRRQAGRWSQQAAQQEAAAQQAAAPQAAPAPAAPAPAGDQPDYLAELQELAKLRDAGILTEEEFSAKKSQLLGI